MAKKLYKSQKKIITGVCGGVAEYFNIDPIIIRIAAIVLMLFTGFFPMVIVYIVASVLITTVPLDEDENLRSANIKETENAENASTENANTVRTEDDFNSYFGKDSK